jgi:beta-N-acetylhexosaminidase
VPDDSEVRRLALSCLLLGFVGPTPPAWLLAALGEGLGGVVLFGSNVGDGGEQVRELTDRLRSAAGRDIVVAIDEEGGDVTRLDTLHGSASPGAAALGALDDPAATEEVYAAIGARLAEAGVTLDLAPVADVNVEPLNPVVGVRSFGAQSELVARHVAAAVRGIQRGGTAACLKHFPGHGATRSDSHHQVAVLDRAADQLRAVEFVPFSAGIAAGSRAVMTGHLLAPALDADALTTISAPITRTLLRDELGFTGAVVTDALEMRAVADTIGMVEGFVQALAAGADAIETGALDYPELVEAIPRAVAAALADGRLTLERLQDASHRTAELAGVGDPQVRYDADAVAGVPARCVEVSRPLPRLHAPLVVECRPPDGMASGALPWSLAGPLAQLVAGTEGIAVGSARDLAAVAARADERSLVVVVRDPDRHAWQDGAVALADARPGSVIVDVGWPALLTGQTPVVRTRGVAPELLRAAARALAEGGSA